MYKSTYAYLFLQTINDIIFNRRELTQSRGFHGIVLLSGLTGFIRLLITVKQILASRMYTANEA